MTEATGRLIALYMFLRSKYVGGNLVNMFMLIVFFLGYVDPLYAQTVTGKGIYGQANVSRLETNLGEHNRTLSKHQEILNRLTELLGPSNIRRELSGPVTWVVGITQDGNLEYMDFPGVRCPDSKFLVGLDTAFQPICEEAVRPIRRASGGGGGNCALGGMVSMGADGNLQVQCNTPQ